MYRHLAFATILLAGLGGTAAQAQPMWSLGTVEPAGDWRKAFCIEHDARIAGRLAYLEVRLELTEAQRPLWDKWRDAVKAGSEQERAACLQDAKTQEEMPSIVDRLSRLERILGARAEALKSAQPALQALYQALTPDQQDVIDQPWSWAGHRAGGHQAEGPAAKPQ